MNTLCGIQADLLGPFPKHLIPERESGMSPRHRTPNGKRTCSRCLENAPSLRDYRVQGQGSRGQVLVNSTFLHVQYSGPVRQRQSGRGSRRPRKTSFSIYLSIYLSISLCICRHLYIHIYLSIYEYICIYVYIYIYV
jgi:hypothetical protein